MKRFLMLVLAAAFSLPLMLGCGDDTSTKKTGGASTTKSTSTAPAK